MRRLNQASLPATGGVEITELAQAITAQFSDGQYPHLAEFTVDHVLQPGYDFTAEFEFGLDLILDGLAAAMDGKMAGSGAGVS